MKDMSPLNSWLRVDTWHTGHPKDDERFYKAIYQLISNNDLLPDPESVRDYIIVKTEGQFDAKYLEGRADEAMNRYDAVSSFLFENKIKL